MTAPHMNASATGSGFLAFFALATGAVSVDALLAKGREGTGENKLAPIITGCCLLPAFLVPLAV